MGDETEGDELLKRLWRMPPKPHAKIKPRAKKKAKKRKPR